MGLKMHCRMHLRLCCVAKSACCDHAELTKKVQHGVQYQTLGIGTTPDLDRNDRNLELSSVAHSQHQYVQHCFECVMGTYASVTVSTGALRFVPDMT